jgi:hypothetical protein
VKTPIGVHDLRDIAPPCVRLQRCLGKSPRRANSKNRQNSNKRIYIILNYEINPPQERNPMAFRPNYGRDRVERQRAARARTEEKQRKKDEKVALRKAERVAAEAPPDDKGADDKQS